MTDKTPVEMFNELIELGYIVPGEVEPDGMMEPTAYISAPTTLAFATPPVPELQWEQVGGKANAKLGRRSQRNKGGKERSKRR
jgi:hypothetical protein